MRVLYCSALCGIIATTVKGGNIFKFDDNVCSVGTYTGSPEHYEDDQVSVLDGRPYIGIVSLFPGASDNNLHETICSFTVYIPIYNDSFNYI